MKIMHRLNGPMLIRGVVAALMAVTTARTCVAAPTPAPGPAPGPGQGQGGRLQAFIENARCYEALPRHAHKPDFRIVRMRGRKYRKKFFWFMDGKQRIGLLNLSFGEIEMFRFFPPAEGERVEYKMPAVYHWSTLRGPRITIVPQGTWTDRGEMTYLQDKGESLRLRYSETSEDETQIVHHMNLRFDPVLGYIWDCAVDLTMTKPKRFEYANILTGGLAESREERKRFQKCIWTRRDGVLCYMYQNPLSMIHAGGREWADMQTTGGFVGWVAERDMNPFLEILQSTPDTTLITCSVWYDQHFIALPPEQLGDDGLYHVQATYRLLSLPLPVAKELEGAARTMLPARPGAGPMGFRQGVVNDFETSIPAGTLYNGCMWGHSAQLETTTGYSGTRSLRLRGRCEAQPVHGGTPICVETAKRYRLRAWVRTSGVTGKGASLRVNEVFWNWTDVRATHRSQSLTGDTDWTRLEIEFKPIAGDPFAMPGVILDGDGTAWFDDIELIQIPR
ncbi:MAG: hypothetical protein O2901_00515 [Verrucomicrobia bacterium]|nr:hypothetical protein [Verrucomicrobiota bacterium]